MMARGPSLALVACIGVMIALTGSANARPTDFSDYAVPAYRGPIAQPRFRGSGAKYSIFRTRIRLGAKAVNFAGHFAIMRIGCGAGCTINFLVDLKTGRISDFPLGGEDHYALVLSFRPDSRLIKARWEDAAGPACIAQFLVVWAAKTIWTLPKQRFAGRCEPYSD
jgi:hypothetical protein